MMRKNSNEIQKNKNPNYLVVHQLLLECLAECIGTFIYVFPGQGATAALLISSRSSTTNTSNGSPTTPNNLGSLLNIGLAYSCGIMLAILLTGHISGAHLSPAVTLTFKIFRQFPTFKIIPFIISQLLGSIIATLTVYSIYEEQLEILKKDLMNLGLSQFIISSLGPAGVGGIFPNPNQNLARVFLGEFLVGSLLGFVILGSLDKQNTLINHHMIPFLIAMAYLVSIMAFSPNTIVLNTARGLGGHIGTSIIYGPQVFNQNPSFIALATLTNIPATIVGSLLYNLMISFKKSERSKSVKSIVVVVPEQQQQQQQRQQQQEEEHGGVSRLAPPPPPAPVLGSEQV